MTMSRRDGRIALLLLALVVAVVTLALTNTPLVYQPENTPQYFDPFFLFGT